MLGRIVAWLDRLTGRDVLRDEAAYHAHVVENAWEHVPARYRGETWLAKAVRLMAKDADAERADHAEARVELSRSRADAAAWRGRADRAEQELAVARDALRTRVPELQARCDEQAAAIAALEGPRPAPYPGTLD